MKYCGEINSENERYLYRYDGWMNHIDLEGQQLSARCWPLSSSFPHHQIDNARKELKKGQDVFAIFFWNSLEIGVNRALKAQHFHGPTVLQRVRSDHAYLKSYQCGEDEHLKGEASIYWNVEPLGEDQNRSRNGISLRDLEVLDLDGVWRPYNDSEYMAPAHIRLAKAGFRPFYYGMYGGVVYHASCRNKKPDGKKRVIVLLYSPPEENHVITNQVEAISSFLTSFINEHHVYPDDVELYMFADVVGCTSKPYIAKYEAHRAQDYPDRKVLRSGFLCRKQIFVGPRRIKVDLDDIVIVSTETHEDWLTDLFRLPSGKEITRRSMRALEQLNQSTASTSEPA